MQAPFTFKAKRSRANHDHDISDSDEGEESNRSPAIDVKVEARSYAAETKRSKISAAKGEAKGPVLVDYYLTKVHGLQDKYNAVQSFGVRDILSERNGELVASAQFNYMFEVDWLIEQYPPRFRNLPLVLVHGEQRESQNELRAEIARYPNISLVQAHLSMPFGTHHSKMMMLAYADGSLRVVVHTANMIQMDWHLKTQAGWFSPAFPAIQGSSTSTNEVHCDSPTRFKTDLIEYLKVYGAQNRYISEWISRVRAADMRQANVYLIASVPGRHDGARRESYGHMKLRRVLHNAASHPFTDSHLVAQFSSIGSLGSSPDNWLLGEFFESLFAAADADRQPATCSCAARAEDGQDFCCVAMRNRHEAACKQMMKRIDRRSAVSCIFPSVDDVRESLEGYIAGGSLPYSQNTAAKQPWLRSFACRWRAGIRGRTRCSPHIKTYMVTLGRQAKQCAWFLITSANLSKAAWGALERNGSQLAIRSYELGVLFVPDSFAPGSSHFVLVSPEEAQKFGASNQREKAEAEAVDGAPRLVAPYDLPATKYGTNDKMWVWDASYTDEADIHGRFFQR